MDRRLVAGSTERCGGHGGPLDDSMSITDGRPLRKSRIPGEMHHAARASRRQTQVVGEPFEWSGASSGSCTRGWARRRLRSGARLAWCGRSRPSRRACRRRPERSLGGAGEFAPRRTLGRGRPDRSSWPRLQRWPTAIQTRMVSTARGSARRWTSLRLAPAATKATAGAPVRRVGQHPGVDDCCLRGRVGSPSCHDGEAVVEADELGERVEADHVISR